MDPDIFVVHTTAVHKRVDAMVHGNSRAFSVKQFLHILRVCSVKWNLIRQAKFKMYVNVSVNVKNIRVNVEDN